MIYFNPYDHEQYNSAAQQNALESDMTISFTAGGVYAAEACKVHHNVDISQVAYYNIREFETLQKLIRRHEVKVINITGDDAVTFRPIKLQVALDEYLRYYFDRIFAFGKPLIVRSTGQSGAGEAGLKYADKAGIKTICTAPSYWAYRDDTGKLIKNESEFKCRFGIVYDLF